jgi:hypothetical protein
MHNFKLAIRLAVLILVLCAAPVVAMSAEDAAPPSGAQQQPAPDLPANPLPGTAAPSDKAEPPVPDPGTTGQAACIDEIGDYATHGNAVTFVIGLTNKCDKRLKCKIFAYVVGAKGPSSGQTTMILGAKSSGAAATNTYAMRVKAAGGTAQVSRECGVF